ncbi:conserved hypothetical protein [Beutenbergia cavernae DSM 12333]|uniref:Metal-dependent HD superfamily phosphohydrolase n=2 Tax=Beutenbergia TaxID=84756 RepID=C5BZC7_BEUC1|nr:conserved hypothetical protein [Beutenbergia cavernae DSM 12333]
MGVIDAPQWLPAAWARSARAIGATASAEEIDEVGTTLVASWSEPGRFHHNLKHLVDVLARIDELAQETHAPDVVRVAGWYHGVVFSAGSHVAYKHRGGEDPVASAERARRELTDLGVADDVVERIARLVSGVDRHSADIRDIDAQALNDADLATLAVEPQKYAAYRKAVREEYAHIPVRDYLTHRIAILTKLLARPSLFSSPMAQGWEEPARENVTAELSRLQSELRALPPDEPSEGAAEGEPAGEGATSPAEAPRPRRLSPDHADPDSGEGTLSRPPPR